MPEYYVELLALLSTEESIELIVWTSVAWLCIAQVSQGALQ